MEPLTPEQMEDAANLVLLMLMVGLVVFGLVGSWALRLVQWWHARRGNDMSNDDAGDDADLEPVPPAMELSPNAPVPRRHAVPGGFAGGTGSVVVNGVSRHMSDTEIIALLAVQRNGQAERFSASAIHRLVGGRRESVLDIVRAVRNVPEYRRTPEQAAQVDAARRELKLSE